MAGATRRATAQEAAMKYFLLGAFSSAFLLYGIALCYGATRTTNLAAIARATATTQINSALLLAGVAMLAVGFCFKVAAVPFHMWTPDVYQGAPTPVTAFMAAGTKAAGFAGFLRVFAGALGGLVLDWRPVIAGVAVVTMLGGAVLATVQTDLKRMLAYSSIAHAGYLLIGLAAAPTNPEGISASMFYLLAYAFMVMGAFMVVQYAARRGRGGGRGAAGRGRGGRVLAIRALAVGARAGRLERGRHTGRSPWLRTPPSPAGGPARAVHVRAGRHPAAVRLLGQVLRVPGRHQRGSHLAGGHRCRQLGDLSVLLPAGHHGDVLPGALGAAGRSGPGGFGGGRDRGAGGGPPPGSGRAGARRRLGRGRRAD